MAVCVSHAADATDSSAYEVPAERGRHAIQDRAAQHAPSMIAALRVEDLILCATLMACWLLCSGDLLWRSMNAALTGPRSLREVDPDLEL
jgi:hypothetical protein